MSKFKEQFCQFIDTNAKTLSNILKDINQAKMEKSYQNWYMWFSRYI